MKEKFGNQGNLEVDSLIIKDGSTNYNVLQVYKNLQQTSMQQGVTILDLTNNFNTKVENALGDNLIAIQNLGNFASALQSGTDYSFPGNLTIDGTLKIKDGSSYTNVLTDLNSKENSTDLVTKLASKANSSNVYTKSEIKPKFNSLVDNIPLYVSKFDGFKNADCTGGISARKSCVSSKANEFSIAGANLSETKLS